MATHATQIPREPAAAPPAPGVREAFLSGLLRTSWPSLLLTVLVALGWVGLLVARVTPEWVASADGMRLAAHPGDRDVRVTGLALDLRRRAELPEPAVFLLGASDLQEALTSWEDLERRLPAGTRVLDLFCAWQSLLDTAALVEMFPARITGVVLVTVSPKRIAHGIAYHFDFEDQPPFHRRFGFRSEVREEIAAREGVPTDPRSASLLIENYRFYLPRLGGLLWNHAGPPRLRHHGWTEVTGPRLTDGHLERMRAELRRVLAGYEANRADSFELLARILAMVEERGGEVALLEAPFSPAGERLVVGEALRARYQQEVTDFAREHGVPYWRLGPELALEDADFRDDQHLITGKARQAFTGALAARLRSMLPAGTPRASLGEDGAQ